MAKLAFSLVWLSQFWFNSLFEKNRGKIPAKKTVGEKTKRGKYIAGKNPIEEKTCGEDN